MNKSVTLHVMHDRKGSATMPISARWQIGSSRSSERRYMGIGFWGHPLLEVELSSGGQR